jgi:AcrR family transcriptional regulator
MERGVLRSITYASELAREFGEEALAELTRSACLYNKAHGVTGVLVCLGNRFVQVLEGPGPAVGALYGRIRLDPRHRDVTTVHDAPIEARAYADWAMRRLRIEDLGEAERAMLFRALSQFGPRTLLGSKPEPIEGPAAARMEQIMARVIPARLPIEEAEAISSLLQAAEARLLGDVEADETVFDDVAGDANVNPRRARCYFPTITDLFRTCVQRKLAIEHQALLTRMISDKFEDEAALARCITDFAIRKIDLANASEKCAEQFALHGGSFTSEAARIIAAAVLEASPREGWPFPDLSPTILAMSIVATVEAARTAARVDASMFTSPGMRVRLLDICLVALVGGPNSHGAIVNYPSNSPGGPSTPYPDTPFASTQTTRSPNTLRVA